jgi:hypothetical protein
MPTETWEKYVNTDPDSLYDEKNVRIPETGSGSWHIEGDSLHQNYNHIRSREVQNRNREVFHKFTGFYLSRNGIIVLAVSIVLCLVTSSLSLEGLFFWNMVLAIVIWGFCEMTSRTEVQPEWNEVWEEINDI